MNIPAATYRIQFNSTFTFKDFLPVIDYLHTLGISTVYAAPITQAEPGSVHGYDVTDANTINPEIGTLSELEQIALKLKQRGMTWLQDIVPNHMAFSMDNPWLFDVLERGQYSPYYTHFDILWEHPEIKGQVQIPVLGKELKQSIEAQEIKIIFNAKGFFTEYLDKTYPLSITALATLIGLMKSMELPEPYIQHTEKLWTDAYNAPLQDWKKTKQSYIVEIFKEEAKSPHIANLLEKINNDASILKELLNTQAYKLAYWKTADAQMNYRRFFTVNSLICLSIEKDDVFNDYNALFIKLYNEGLVQGFRIDHIDGLYNPAQYIDRLRAKVGSNCYLIAEKILEYHETLPADWKLEGTSGYEFLSYINGVLTSMAGSDKIRKFYQSFSNEARFYQDIVFDKKRAFLYSQMRGELQNLMQLLQDLQLVDAQTDLHALKKALGLFMAGFPVYRIYPTGFPLSEESLLAVSKALETAQTHDSNLDKEFGFIKSLFDGYGNTPPEKKLAFIMRLMQFTGPLAAKGVEDTTFYVYNPLISHNEVGDAPEPLGISAEEFHEKMRHRQAHTPFSLNATSTHDTKRGEDARMRINALSHFPEEWAQLVETWHSQNKALIKDIDNSPAPSPNDEYFIYQSLLGAFPENMTVTEEFLDRSKAFILKALREAKVHTTYTEPNEAYEQACSDFIVGLAKGMEDFHKSFFPFLKKIMAYAEIHSLSQIIIKSTAPGIPDFYQGTELWDLSYVDPDNRRPVDFEFRKQMLNILSNKDSENAKAIDFAKEHQTQGLLKLYTTYKILQLRAAYTDVFVKGDYTSVFIQKGVGKVLSYIRSYHNNHVWVIIPLEFEIVNGAIQVDEDITLSVPESLPDQWSNIFTNYKINFKKELQLKDLLTDFPLAVLNC